MKTINIIKILGIIGLLFLLPSISNAQIQRVWNIAEYTSTMLPPPATGTKVAYRTLNNSLYYWDGTQWKRIAGPGIVDTSYSLSFSSPTLSLLGSGSSVSLTNLYTAGYGLTKTGEAWKADTTAPSGLATRLFAKTLPSIITSGQVAYSNGSNLVGSANHFWDNTNVRLGIGTNTPSYSIHSSISQNSSTTIASQNTSSGSSALADFNGINNTGSIASFGMTGSNYSIISAAGGSSGLVYSSGGGGIAIVAQSGPIKFATGALSESMRFTNSDGLLVGTSTGVTSAFFAVRSGTKSSSPFPLHTTAQSNAITGVSGNFEWLTDGIGPGFSWYNGTRKAYGLESTFNRGTATRIPFFDANGQVTDNGGFTYNSSTNQLGVTSSGGSNFLLANFQNTSAALSYIQIANATRNILRFEYPGVTSWDLNVVPTLFSINSSGTTRMSVNSSGAAIIQTSLAVPAITGLQSLTITKTDNGAFYLPLTLQSNGTAPTSIYHTGKSPGIIFDEIGSYSWRIGTSGAINSDFRFVHSGAFTDSKFHITSGYKVAIGSTSTPVRDLDVTGELRVTDLTTDTPTRIVGADGDGDFGAVGLGSNLSISSGTLNSTDTNFGNTNITATGTRTHDMQNFATVLSNSAGFYITSGGITPGSSVLSDAVFAQYQYYNLAKTRSFAKYQTTDTRTGIYTTNPNFIDLYEFNFSGSNLYEYGNRVELDTTNGVFIHTLGGKDYAGFVTSKSTRPSSGALYRSTSRFSWFGSTATENETADTYHTIWHTGGDMLAGLKDGGKFLIGQDSSMIFDPFVDVPQFNKMGLGNKEAVDLSKTQSNYIAGFATDGTLLDLGLGSSLKTTGGLLDIKNKSLLDSLPLASVTIDAGGNDLVINNLTSFELSSDGGDGSLLFNDTNFEVEAGAVVNLSTYSSVLNLDNEVELYAPNLNGINSMRIDSAGFHYSFVNTDATTDSAMTLFTDYDRGLLKLHKYGKDNHTVATTGEYPVRVAGVSSSGYVQDFRLARDTFIEDVTLFSVGSLMYDCQELTIVSSMTVLAASDQEIRFPDAADYLRGKKIIVYSKKKDAGIYIPRIKVVGGVSRLYYTTNPGVGGTDPSNQAALDIDDSVWSDHGTTFEFTCLKIDNTPSYRWVLKQR